MARDVVEYLATSPVDAFITVALGHRRGEISDLNLFPGPLNGVLLRLRGPTCANEKTNTKHTPHRCEHGDLDHCQPPLVPVRMDISLKAFERRKPRTKRYARFAQSMSSVALHEQQLKEGGS